MSQFKRALFFQLGLIVAVLAGLAWAVRHFPVMHYLLSAQQKIGAMELWGGVLYPLLYAACNVLLLPGGVLAIGSGFFFGLWWGFLINVAGNVTGAAVAFFISRKLGRRWVEKRFFQKRKWVALDAAIARDGWKIIFLSQVHPLFPTSLLNYLYGITRIRFSTCMLWIALGQTPGLFLYAYLGTLTQLGVKILRGKSHPQPIEYVLWIGGLMLTVVATYALARIALRLLSEIEATASEEREPVLEKAGLEIAVLRGVDGGS
jgi:uncharacterized membrane protein YdjX (TVP38/TMEM64 family)